VHEALVRSLTNFLALLIVLFFACQHEIVITVSAGAQPWTDGWSRLVANRHASPDWRPDPQAIVYRGRNPVHAENYAALFNDAAAAYALALRWEVSRDAACADKAMAILNAWSSTLTGIDGSSDKFLASGLYGYQLANAAELLRAYPKWVAADRRRLQAMMLAVIYPMNHDFLTRHNGAKIDHYWANWDLANMASMLAIGVLTDRRDIYDEAVAYFKQGAGNGAIEHVVWKTLSRRAGTSPGQWPGPGTQHAGHRTARRHLRDGLESGRRPVRLRRQPLPARRRIRCPIQPRQRGAVRRLRQQRRHAVRHFGERPRRCAADLELIYNHYVVLKGLSAPDIAAYVDKGRPEGGGGDYGPNSGGFDQLGFGTLTFSLRSGRP